MTEKTIKKVNFVDNGDGTVSDLTNKIMWLKNDTWIELGRLINWHESQGYAQAMNEKTFAGYSNWRVPHLVAGFPLGLVKPAVLRQLWGMI